MLYQVLEEKKPESVAILCVATSKLNLKDSLVTDGNAAHSATTRLPLSTLQKLVQQPKRITYCNSWAVCTYSRYSISKQIVQNINQITEMQWWSPFDDTKRRIMAELLIPNIVPASAITGALVSSRQSAYNLQQLLASRDLLPCTLTSSPFTFFQNQLVAQLENISFVLGDIFFSPLHTLTLDLHFQFFDSAFLLKNLLLSLA
jgi:hypothetical protein